MWKEKSSVISSVSDVSSVSRPRSVCSVIQEDFYEERIEACVD